MTKTSHESPPHILLLSRLARSICLGLFLIFIALMMGMFGYHSLENMTWIDAFVSAAMILSGMGPMGELHTSAGKIFAGSYALFSGLFFIAVVGIILAPVAQHFFKKIHLEIYGNSKSSPK